MARDVLHTHDDPGVLMHDESSVANMTLQSKASSYMHAYCSYY
jgi:hypothetical protein